MPWLFQLFHFLSACFPLPSCAFGPLREEVASFDLSPPSPSLTAWPSSHIQERVGRRSDAALRRVLAQRCHLAPSHQASPESRPAAGRWNTRVGRRWPWPYTGPPSKVWAPPQGFRAHSGVFNWRTEAHNSYPTRSERRVFSLGIRLQNGAQSAPGLHLLYLSSARAAPVWVR